MYTGTVPVTFTVQTQLRDVVTKTDLGFYQDQPGASEIEATVKIENPAYQTGNVDVTNVTSTGATLTGKNLYTRKRPRNV